MAEALLFASRNTEPILNDSADGIGDLPRSYHPDGQPQILHDVYRS